MNLWNLSANAQTRLVQILDERYPDNAQFMSALSRNYQAEWRFACGGLYPEGTSHGIYGEQGS